MKREDVLSQKKYRFGVVLSTSLGNRTRYLNFRKYADLDPDVEFTWAPVSHYIPPGEHDPFKHFPRALRARAIVFYQSLAVLRHLPTLDAVFVHLYEVDILLALRSYLFRGPLRVISTDDAPAVDPASYPFHPVDKAKAGWRKRIRLGIDLWRSRRADFLIPFSTWAAGLHREGAGKPEAQVSAIHVGIDLSLWPDRDHDQPRDAGARVQALFVGGEFVRKGGDLLLETWRRHFQDTVELHLVTQGAPADLPAHVHVHADLGANDPRLAALYRSADIFVLPTTSDLSSWVTLEAMASGCPAIVTPVGGIPDLVDPGVTGLMVPPGDMPALQAAMQSLIDDPARRAAMGRAARLRVEERFDAAKNVARMLQIMKRLVDERRSAKTSAAA